MNLRDLEYALAVAEHGHFSRAAEACDVSQPTLSGQIRKLEDELGVRLFERDGRRVRVTAPGAALLEYARTAVGAAGDLMRAAETSRDPLVGALRIGMIPTLAPYLLPYVLPAVQRQFALMPLTIAEEPTDMLIARLQSGELDVAAVATDHRKDGLLEIVLFDEPLYAAVPADHPLARRDAVDVDDLDPATLLLLTDGHCLRDQALALCSRAGTPGEATRSDLRAASLATLLNLVQAGYGITLVPALALDRARPEPRGVVTVPVRDPHASRRVRLAFRRHAPRRAAFERLAAVIRAAVPADRLATGASPGA